MKIAKIKLIGLLIICIALYAIADNHRIYGIATQRIALLPFTINAAENLSFLRDGIYDMFMTRLSSEGRVETISRTKVEEALKAEMGSGILNEDVARRIGSILNADFVLYGSLTVLEGNVSIDAKMVDITAGQKNMALYDQSGNLGDVITKVDRMATGINRKISGQTSSSIKGGNAQPPRIKKSDIQKHPENLFKEQVAGNHGDIEAVDGISLLPEPIRASGQKFWKSANFTRLINGVSLGDVDGDGKIETVTIAPHAVIIYRLEDGRFRKLHEVSTSGYKNLTGLDIADINGNGYAEIFITTLNAKKNILTSMVLEYDGRHFVKIIDDSPWFYRVADTPVRGKILLGQRSKVGKFYSGRIYEMSWQNREYVALDQIKTPPGTNLMGLTVGDVLNDGQETAAAFKQNDHIRVFDRSGNIIWESGDRYGGSMMYYNGPKEDLGDVENRIYLPMRLLVRNSEAGNESSVITVVNHELTDMKLRYRKFTKSDIEAFVWDGIGLAPKWKTRTISGYTQDFAIGDFDNDGHDELVAAIILEEGSVLLMTKPKSTLIAIQLSKAEKPTS